MSNSTFYLLYCTPPSGNFFVPEASTNGIVNFNFLALLLSEILGGTKFTLGALRPLDAPSGEIFVPKASTSQYLIVFLISTF